PLIVVAGVLVGVGARYGGGCTSGHGVCGIARLSARSIVATGHFHGHRNRCGCNNAARLWRLNHASGLVLSVGPALRFRFDDLVHDAARKGSWLSRHFWPLGPDARLRYGGCARHLQHGLRVGTTSDTAGHRSPALLAEKDRHQPTVGYRFYAFRDWLVSALGQKRTGQLFDHLVGALD